MSILLAYTQWLAEQGVLKPADKNDPRAASALVNDFHAEAEVRYAPAAHQLREVLIGALEDLYLDADGVCHACSQPVAAADWPAHAADAVLELLPLLSMATTDGVS